LLLLFNNPAAPGPTKPNLIFFGAIQKNLSWKILVAFSKVGSLNDPLEGQGIGNNVFSGGKSGVCVCRGNQESDQ
jgi:hypothetical protein